MSGVADDWGDRALAAVMERVTTTEAQVGERFPLYAEPRDGMWKTTGRGSWTGGFWAGLLWLRARYSGSEADRRTAAGRTAALAPWADVDTVTRGLIFWYPTALADGDPQAAVLQERAARAVLAARDPELGVVPWGDAFGGPRLQARADGVPGTVPLLATVAPGAAAEHLRRHLDLCLGAEGEPLPAWRFEGGDVGWRPCEEPGRGWSRGRAWLLLAVADALLLPGAAAHDRVRLTAAARRLLSLEGVLSGPFVLPDDHAAPYGPLDTSAAAITAVALLKLARLPEDWAHACSCRGVVTLSALAENHLTYGGSGRPAGMLLDGCYDAGRGLAERHELVWGDFFLALGLASLNGLVDLTRV
ncbi:MULTISPECIES: sugar ABC transporter permease [unclassified Streptomyces]|uniref:sugar ABC transporter permease n=1 Tax=unclassified Streptomyces TaxID=2593676 RepID=UPI0035E12D41